MDDCLRAGGFACGCTCFNQVDSCPRWFQILTLSRFESDNSVPSSIWVSNCYIDKNSTLSFSILSPFFFLEENHLDTNVAAHWDLLAVFRA